MPVYAYTLLTLLYVALTAAGILAGLYLIVPRAYRRSQRRRTR
ncbi:hypothetical protein [Streptomyces sp. AC495_CC817]|nr:hypothetical protein [Streptomyces sp. AC495_CC817]